MDDQFGNSHDLATLRGDVAVVVFADRQGAEASRTLGIALHVLFHPSAEALSPADRSRAPVRPIPDWPQQVRMPDVKMIPVACVGAVPWLLRPYVRGRFRSAVPDAPIWLDLTDYMRKQFGVSPGVPNVIVFDTVGQERFRIAGNLNEAQLSELADVIEKVRREAKPR
jgi:hypothetical protein